MCFYFSTVMVTEADHLSSKGNHVGRLVDRSRDYVSVCSLFVILYFSKVVVLG